MTKTKATDIRCPTCGHRPMTRVVRDVETKSEGVAVVVRKVQVDECPKCGERLYDLEALRRVREAREKRGRPTAA
jgi:YgiT-type zinc finger domain-containing protein